MNKQQAIHIITQAAKVYDTMYNSKNLLFVVGAPNSPNIIETAATAENFLHLTGVKLNTSIKDNVPLTFFENARDNKLKEVEFDFKNGTTEQKLKVLLQTLNISSNAKMVGDYINGRVNLKTEKIAGGVNSFLGFIKTGRYYTPNTVIADDVRKNTGSVQRVLAVLSKGINEPEYNSIITVAKKIEIKPLLAKLSQSVKIDNSLFQDEGTSISTQAVSSPMENHTLDNNIIPKSYSIQGDGTIALAPQAPQSDLFTRIANALVKGLDNVVHKASMAFEKINVAATKALNTLFAPEQPKKPHIASQSQSKGKSLAKAKNAEMARPAAPVKQSEQKQEKRSSVLADLKAIKAEQAQDKPERSRQRSKSKSNNIEL